MGGAVPALRRSLSHGGRRLRNFTRALLARADKFQDSMDLGSPDAAAACGADAAGLQLAQDFLVSHLYAAVHRELRGLLWDQCEQEEQNDQHPEQPTSTTASDHQDQPAHRRRARRSRPPRGADDDQRRWKCEWERDCSSLKPPTQ